MRELSKQWKRDQFVRQQGRCCWCSRPMDMHNRRSKRFATIEHLIPQSQNGPTTPENCRLACWLCNNDRGNGKLVGKRLNRWVAEQHVRRLLGLKPLRLPAMYEPQR